MNKFPNNVFGTDRTVSCSLCRSIAGDSELRPECGSNCNMSFEESDVSQQEEIKADGIIYSRTASYLVH